MFRKVSTLLSAAAVLYNGCPLALAGKANIAGEGESAASPLVPGMADVSKMLPGILEGINMESMEAGGGAVMGRVVKSLSDPRMSRVLQTLTQNPDTPTSEILDMMPGADREVMLVMVNTVRSLMSAMKDGELRNRIEDMVAKGVEDIVAGKDKKDVLQDIMSSEVFEELRDDIVGNIDEEPVDIREGQ